MKNKKLILITVFIMILSVTLLGFTACNKDNGININQLASAALQKYPTQSEIISLDSLSSYQNQITYDYYIYLSGTTDEGKYKYCLYSLVENKILTEDVADSYSDVSINSSYKLFVISVNNPEELSTRTVFYDVFGEVISYDTAVTVTAGKNDADLTYAVLSDNGTILLDETGKGTYIPYSPAPQVSNMSVQGKYLLYQSMDTVYVYDRSLCIISSFNLNSAFPASSEMEIIYENETDDLVLKTYYETVTDENDDDYDFIDENGNRTRCYQYCLDLSTGITSTLSDNYVISSIVSTDITQDYVFAYFYYVTDKSLGKTAQLGLFDTDFNLVTNISDIIGTKLGTVTDIDKIGDFVIFSGTNSFVFLKDGKVAYTLDYSYGSQVLYSRYFYINLVYFDSFTGNTFTGIPKDAILQNTSSFTDGLIYYKVNEEIVNDDELTYIYRTYVYDVKTGITTLIDDSDNVTFSQYYYTIANTENGVSYYDIFSNKLIFETSDYNTITVNNINGGHVFSCKKADDSVDRFILKIS